MLQKNYIKTIQKVKINYVCETVSKTETGAVNYLNGTPNLEVNILLQRMHIKI